MSDENYLAVVRFVSHKDAVKFNIKASNDASAFDEMRRRAGVRDTLDLHSYQLMRVGNDNSGVFYTLVAEKYGAEDKKKDQSLAPEKKELEEKPYTTYSVQAA